jgi:phosphoglycerate dehydrogenase-like enzyme
VSRGLRVLSHLGVIPEVAAALPDVEIVAIPTDAPPEVGVRGEVLLTLMRGVPNIAEVLERGVRWVHTIGTGVDEFPLELLGDRVLTCSRGANAVPIAEWVMAQILAVEKHLPDMWVEAPPETWGTPNLGSPAGQTLAILGLGSIATNLARRALAFDMHVRALRRSTAPSLIEEVEVVTSIEALVADADHFVLAVPSTPETRGVVDEAFLGAMRRGAHLVNVARADLIDEVALRRALDDGRLGLASIDVAPVEPLPGDHWFYSHPLVRFSPHVSWSGPAVWAAMTEAFVTNCRRWMTGAPLEGVVDVIAGY